MTSAHPRPVHAALTSGNIVRYSASLSFEEVVARVIDGAPRATLAAKSSGVFTARMLDHWSAAPENPSAQHRRIPACYVVPLSRAAGSVEIVEWMARAVGHELYPLVTTPATPRPFLTRVAAFMRESSEVQGAAADALADATISATDRATVAAQLREALAEGAALLDALERDVRKPGTRAAQ